MNVPEAKTNGQRGHPQANIHTSIATSSKTDEQLMKTRQNTGAKDRAGSKNVSAKSRDRQAAKRDIDRITDAEGSGRAEPRAKRAAARRKETKSEAESIVEALPAIEQVGKQSIENKQTIDDGNQSPHRPEPEEVTHPERRHERTKDVPKSSQSQDQSIPLYTKSRSVSLKAPREFPKLPVPHQLSGSVGVLRDELLGDISNLRSSISTAVAMIERDAGTGLDQNRPANLEPLPALPLEDIYRRVLGHHSASMAIKLQNHNRLGDYGFLHSLISAFFVKEVFYQRLPWNTPLALLREDKEHVKASLQKVFEGFETRVHSAAMDQVKNTAFQENVLRIAADKLLARLMLVLNDHFAHFRNRNNPQNWATSFESWLRQACKEALLLHGKMEASEDEFQVVWSTPGLDFSRDMMELPNREIVRDSRKALHAMFPGFRCTPCDNLPPYVVKE